MKEYALFLGCTIPEKALGYEIAARRIAWELDIRFIKADFGCCGETIMKLNPQMAVALAAKNLAEAEKLRLDICVLCVSCHRFLSEVNEAMKKDKKFRDDVNRKTILLAREYYGGVEVKHFIEVITEEGLQKIREKSKKRLQGIKVAVQGGCFNHTIMEDIIKATGAESVECGKDICLSLPVDEHTIKDIAEERISCIRDKVDALVVGCPICGTILDRKKGIPVLYLPQMLGLAFKLPEEDLGLCWNKSDVNILKKKIL